MMFATLAWRNLQKSKAYSAINIFGLALGMAIALMIGLWIWDGLSYNHYHTNHATVAEVMSVVTYNGVRDASPAVSRPVGIELGTKWRSLFQRVAMVPWDEMHILAVGDKKLNEKGMVAQPEFPAMMSIRMTEGQQSVLNDVSSILISASMAHEFFGNEDPMGKTLRMDNQTDLRVGGVFEDLPRNSTFNEAKYFYSWEKYVTLNDIWMKGTETKWDNSSWRLFVQLQPNVTMAQADKAIREIIRPHYQDGNEELTLMPMDKWYLNNTWKNGKFEGGRIQFVWLFGIIGVFVLLLACINFMNLSTARSERRAKEIGIRKTLGSRRGQVIGQLLNESLLVAFLALLVALGLVILSLPYFNSISEKDMHIPWDRAIFWVLVGGFTVFTGLIAGSYPALYLSSFQPIKVLKGTFRVGRLASLPRKILVVIQFTVSVSLIIGTLIVFKQIEYAKNRPVGYSREGLIVLDVNTPEIKGHYNSLRDDMLASGGVADMAESSGEMTSAEIHSEDFQWAGKDPNSKPDFINVAVTHDYGKTVGWSVKEGRDFSRDFPTDSQAYVLNESAAKLMGIAHPIGMKITYGGLFTSTVIGVVHDMVMGSPYEHVKPTIFFMSYGWTANILVRLKPTLSVKDALARIEPVFRKHNPASPFTYRFSDQEYSRKFADDQRIGNLAGIFSVLAIIISCLGLFGLASFVAEQRRKEMGVRKVLGASMYDIWSLLSREFVFLVLLSCAIATPISWYYLSGWLERYSYRTSISWWVFIGASVGALLITLATVSYQAFKAALANPVQSLRTE